MKARKFLCIFVVLLFLSSFSSIEVRSSAPMSPDLAEALRQETGGAVRISYHSETGKVRFIGTDMAHPIAQPIRLAGDATQDVAARSFLATYGPLFGLTDPAQELTVMRERTMDDGRSMVRYQQVHREPGSPGIPVVGGELIVNMDSTKNVLSANGEILPDIQVNTAPALDAETARQIALQKVAKDRNLGVDALIATQPELWIYNPMLLGGTGPKITSLVWRMEVQAKKELFPIRELVLVDAHLGVVVLHFNQIDTALSRTIYDNQNTPSENLALHPAVCTEGNCPGSGDDTNFAYDFAKDTYDFYFVNHSRDSLDGAGMALISTVRYCSTYYLDPCPYPNAFWNGSQMVYGQGYASADDVVGHEMTHGVTDHESRLFYYMQSGAINESFSDIWGEFIDQTNSYDGPGGSVKWLIGEDIGAVRNMQNPPQFGDPDRMGSSNYYCSIDDLGNGDMGGVHTNSGVGNKAAYLLANGDSFNGYDVAQLGIPKTAKIFYEAQTNLLTSASDYQDLYDDLQQACTNLIGTAVTTAADCLEVKDAVDATQMNLQPASCGVSEAPVCPVGQTVNDIFFDDLENPGSGHWVSGSVSESVNEWYYPQNPNPYDFDPTYATSGIYNFWGFDLGAIGDYAMSMAQNITLPPGSIPYLHFEHAFGFENGNYDGGVLEYSANGGAWTDAGSLITENGYNGTISSLGGNPLSGKLAFVNNSNGYISTRLNLNSLAGNNVRFRFRIGTDLLAGDWGWFIDDVRIYTCGSVVTTIPVYLPFVSKAIPPPAAPTNLVAVATSSSAIHLTWNDNAGNEDGYNLERSLNGSTWSPLVTLPANSNSHDDTGLPASTLHYYRVRAYNGGGTSAYSNTASATTQPPTLPGTFYSVGDAGMLQGYPTANFGDTIDMWAGYDEYLNPYGQTARSLVKFDVSAIPNGTSINSATLNVYYVGSYDIPNYTRTITAYRPASDWSELSVTWNNAPSPAESYGSVSITADENWRYVSINVTNLVRGWVNGSLPNYGIMLRGPEVSGYNSSWRSFATREAGSSYTPTLTITYSTAAAASESLSSGENLPGGQTILQVLTGQAYNPLDPSRCQYFSNPQAPGKCLSTR